MIPQSSSSASPSSSPPESLLFRPASYVHYLDLKALFPSDQPLEVELGSGDGGFLVAWAARHPGCNFLGVERLLGRIRKIDRKGRRATLANLRLLRLEAAYFLEYLLPNESVQALHVYFPDPWPKRRHWKNRLVNERFPGLARRVLVPGGQVHLRTDNQEYFDQMRRVFDEDAAYVRTEPPGELASLRTDFEREFLARGIPSLGVSYARVKDR
jgi:tRNA (guanine-N7-)-methyltransferase